MARVRLRLTTAALVTSYCPIPARQATPSFEDALQYTAFALEQFEERADRDGTRLVILASHTLTICDRRKSR